MKKKTKHISRKHKAYHRIHRHVHRILDIHRHIHHTFMHIGELVSIVAFVLMSGSRLFANLTGYSEDLYRNNSSEVAQALLSAIEHPGTSLKQGNIISIRSMDTDVENTFAKGYCTYGAARISPEFFPYIDEYTQQRTWGGNAVDRCKNAAETGYKIGTTPSQGALIIYDAGGRFGSYGHVGKVMHYDSSLKKIIVRDMARVGRGKMSDRREDLTTAQVKCYIYNNKVTSSSDTVASTGTTSGSTVVIPPIVPPISSTTTTSNNQNTNTHNSATTSNNQNTTTTVTQPITPPVIIPPIVQDTIDGNIAVTTDALSDIAEHFLTQNTLALSIESKSPLRIGESGLLTIKIQDKFTGQPFKGVLPFSFGIISSNNAFAPSITNIQLINDGKIEIFVTAKQGGSAAIVITMDEIKIGEFSLEAK